MFFEKLKTYNQLGKANILRVVFYRICLKIGLYKNILPIGISYKGPFFAPTIKTKKNNSSLFACSSQKKEEYNYWIEKADKICKGKIITFSDSDKEIEYGWTPNWQKNCLSNKNEKSSKKHWSESKDFALSTGDIKGIWEISRFDAVLCLARANSINQANNKYLEALNIWFEDWVKHNPFNQGINWKCGQETSIRLMHSLIACHILEKEKSAIHTNNFTKFIYEHALRISKTLSYAIAQDNNHATSEATALFMASLWLQENLENSSDNIKKIKKAINFEKTARKLLHKSTKKLIMTDGSFSQHSTNYHRVMLDSISMAEFWRRKYKSPPLSNKFYFKAKKATYWLASMTDISSGGTPNLGGNDGAILFPIYKYNYLDFRPSVQFASTMFENLRLYKDKGCNTLLNALNIPIPKKIKPLDTQTTYFPDGGYAKFSLSAHCWGFLRLPIYKFRPAHSDALHLDWWHKGINILRDGGTFLYNTDTIPDTDSNTPNYDYFRGTASHNTIYFDHHDQMPILGRFLYGSWLKPQEKIIFKKNPFYISASYKDNFGTSHKREISKINDHEIKIIDHLTGIKSQAILAWRLAPIEWNFSNNSAISSHTEIKITSKDKSPLKIKKKIAYESLFYGQMSEIPAIEVIVKEDTTIETYIKFKD